MFGRTAPGRTGPVWRHARFPGRVTSAQTRIQQAARVRGWGLRVDGASWKWYPEAGARSIKSGRMGDWETAAKVEDEDDPLTHHSSLFTLHSSESLDSL